MKRLVSIIFAIMVLVSLIACTPNETPPAEEPDVQEDRNEPQDQGPAEELDEEDDEQELTDEEEVTYKDGTYDAQGEIREHGSESATVVIENGKIKDIILRRLDTEGNEVDYEQWTGEEVDGKTYPNLKQYRIDLANEMVKEQTYKVDSISGATESSVNWKLAVQRALEKAAQTEQE